MVRHICILVGLHLCVSFVSLHAADWPRFLGPTQNGISAETGLVTSWPKDGVKEAWRIAGGVGMSAVSVQGNIAVTMVQRDGQQVMLAVDAKTGKSLWETPLAPAYKNQMGDGPRSTPTIDGQQVFVLTGEGILACVKLTDGKLQWSVPAVKQLQGTVADYGMASSPLVVGDNVIVNLGTPKAAVAAFDRESGKLNWTAGSGLTGYSSPVLRTIDGKQQVVSITGESAWGIAPADGSLLWSFPYTTDYGCNIAVPLADRNQVFISAGENHGSTLLALKPQGETYKPQVVWESLGPKSALRNEWQTSILLDGHLYGFDNVGGAGPISHLTCVDIATGKPIWQKPRFGKGNAIWADGYWWMITLEGEFVMAKISPAGYEELGRQQLVGKTRQAPTLANGLLYIRDDRDIVCLDLRP